MASARLISLVSICVPLAVIGCAPAPNAATTATHSQQELEGERLFDQYCKTCHAVSGDVVVVGPSLDGIASRAGDRMQGYDAPDYIEHSLKQPGDYLVQGFSDLMPQELADTLTEEEIDALVAYLMTLD